MTDDQNSETNAHAEHQEALLALIVLRVVNDSGELIQKDGLGFREGNAVLLLISTVLSWILLEAQVRHTYSVPTRDGRSTLTSN